MTTSYVAVVALVETRLGVTVAPAPAEWQPVQTEVSDGDALAVATKAPRRVTAARANTAI
jgi:hypothetical protein